jgi:hypothetical protein
MAQHLSSADNDGSGYDGDFEEKGSGRRRESFEYDEGESAHSYSNSNNSSRNISDSRQPILASAFSQRPRSVYGYRIPNSKMRWLCMALFLTIVLFILELVRMSYVSSQATQKKPTPKPPLWESFPFLEKYYGGIRSLVPREQNVAEYPKDGKEVYTGARFTIKRDQAPAPRSIPFSPYPDYDSESYVSDFGTKVDCFLDEQDTIRLPGVRVYAGVPNGFPDAVMGSNDLLEMHNDVCFDRFGRLGPYGLGYSKDRGGSGAGLHGEREGAEDVWKDAPEVDYRKVQWAKVQQRCVSANKHRLSDSGQSKCEQFRAMDGTILFRRDDPADFAHVNASISVPPPTAGQKRVSRQAVVIRTWTDFWYGPEDIMYLRSMIAELSVLSGGEYTIHFLVHVKNNDIPIWADEETYQRVLNEALPEEFRGMGTLWSERQMSLVYGGLRDSHFRDLPVHGVYRSTFMPVQYFAHQHPEYDFLWNWEMDIRYTGHWYHLFDGVGKWAAKQPRKGLWERNERFYVPSVHGSWEDFKQQVRVQTELGTNSPNNLWTRPGPKQPAVDSKPSRPIWGPELPLDDKIDNSRDPVPPTTYEKDHFEWGVGEDADLITFNPQFNPDGTTWLYDQDVTGYNTTRDFPPRRVTIIAASRLSHALLDAMHRETALHGHEMFSEMWPASCALEHGLKSVYAPHPVYIDRNWPVTYLESVFNGGKNGASGGARTAVWGTREHNFKGTTWFYSALWSGDVWRRWLGHKVHSGGGEEAELNGSGRMCLPPFLVHPVKNVQLETQT